MARLVPLLLLIFGVALLLAVTSRAQRGPARDWRAYRPRARFGEGARRAAPGDAPHVVRRAELAGLRDAYSGAAIDPSVPLVRCGRCLALYHADSAVVLARENAGRCVTCGGTGFGAVTVRDA